MAKNRNTFAKRGREIEKSRKAQEKRERRRKRKEDKDLDPIPPNPEEIPPTDEEPSE
jgi:hypothetical protein